MAAGRTQAVDPDDKGTPARILPVENERHSLRDVVVGGIGAPGHADWQEACAPKTSKVTMPQRQAT
jgi:hypothetical protein